MLYLLKLCPLQYLCFSSSQPEQSAHRIRKAIWKCLTAENMVSASVARTRHLKGKCNHLSCRASADDTVLKHSNQDGNDSSCFSRTGSAAIYTATGGDSDMSHNFTGCLYGEGCCQKWWNWLVVLPTCQHWLWSSSSSLQRRGGGGETQLFDLTVLCFCFNIHFWCSSTLLRSHKLQKSWQTLKSWPGRVKMFEIVITT